MLKLNFGGMLNTVLLKTGDLTERFWQVTDQRKSIILTMDSQGNILYHEWFSPYGEAMTGSNENPASSQPLTLYRFSGKEYDGGSGLYYFGARYYSPESGRMLTPDDVNYAHLGGLSGLNLYAYCLENPETFIDSSGNWPHWVGVAVRIAAVGTLTAGAYALGYPTMASYIAELGLGIILGKEFCAITPERATAAAGLSGAVSAFIGTPGDVGTRLASAFWTGTESAISSAIINYGKEKALEWKPELATDHPLVTAVATTGINAIFAYITAYKLPRGADFHKFIGAAGGGELGVVFSFYAGETGSIVSPKTRGNTIPSGRMATARADRVTPLYSLAYGDYDLYSIADRGIIDFTFYLKAGFRKTKTKFSTKHRVIEFNATESNEWNSETHMAAMVEIGVRDKNGNLTTRKADLVVIVHGGVGGYTFIDGGATSPLKNPGAYVRPRRLRPDYHSAISAEALAEHIVDRLGKPMFGGGDRQKYLIKFISCHGGEAWPGLPVAAQILANKTRVPVAGYDQAVSIAETSPGLLNAYGKPLKLVEAKIFMPKSRR